MTDDIFKNKESKDDDNLKPEDKSGSGNEDNTDTYLGLIVNEDGSQKYATAEEALKGGVHAQTHIATLEKELKSLREGANKDEGMEKILEALQGKSKSDEEDESKGVTADDIAQVVTQLMDNRESVTQEKRNITTVVDKFKSVYGEKASETLYG